MRGGPGSRGERRERRGRGRAGTPLLAGLRGEWWTLLFAALWAWTAVWWWQAMVRNWRLPSGEKVWATSLVVAVLAGLIAASDRPGAWLI